MRPVPLKRDISLAAASCPMLPGRPGRTGTQHKSPLFSSLGRTNEQRNLRCRSYWRSRDGSSSRTEDGSQEPPRSAGIPSAGRAAAMARKVAPPDRNACACGSARARRSGRHRRLVTRRDLHHVRVAELHTYLVPLHPRSRA